MAAHFQLFAALAYFAPLREPFFKNLHVVGAWRSDRGLLNAIPGHLHPRGGHEIWAPTGWSSETLRRDKEKHMQNDRRNSGCGSLSGG